MLKIWDARELSKDKYLVVMGEKTNGYGVFLQRNARMTPDWLLLKRTKDIRKALEYFEDYYKMNYCMEELYGRVQDNC